MKNELSFTRERDGACFFNSNFASISKFSEDLLQISREIRS